MPKDGVIRYDGVVLPTGRRLPVTDERIADFVIVGGGIVGLTIARELVREGQRDVTVLEKEPALGLHASGRNSGVLHAGIYYAPGSVKAKVCVRGKRLLEEYAAERSIPWRRDGKVIVARSPSELPPLGELHDRAVANGVRVARVDEKELAEIEPRARTVDWALHSPDTGVIDSRAVLGSLATDLEEAGVRIVKGEEVRRIRPSDRSVEGRSGRFSYGHLVNCAGLQADRLAHWMGVGRRYRILPFRGSYRKLREETARRFRGSIYPVPDPRVPFLGVHLTPTIDRAVILGPTSMPAFGREHYRALEGVSLRELHHLVGDLAVLVAGNRDGMRTLVKAEIAKHLPGRFLAGVRALAPSVTARDIVPSGKVGLRAQLVDEKEKRLVFDFLVEDGPASTHVLNAVSPAFTASMAFAELVVSRILQRSPAFGDEVS